MKENILYLLPPYLIPVFLSDVSHQDSILTLQFLQLLLSSSSYHPLSQFSSETGSWPNVVC